MTQAMTIEDHDDDTGLYLGPARRCRNAGDRHDRPRRRLRARAPRHGDESEVPATAAGRMSMAKKTYGKTASGATITNDLVSKLAERAEAGYDVEETLRRRGGRPPIGSAAASWCTGTEASGASNTSSPWITLALRPRPCPTPAEHGHEEPPGPHPKPERRASHGGGAARALEILPPSHKVFRSSRVQLRSPSPVPPRTP